MASEIRIATVTLNPATDETCQVQNFHAGQVNRVTDVQCDAGGKGVYAAAFLAQYGHRVAATGLLGRVNPAPFESLFSDLGIEDRFVRVPGRTRMNVKLVDRIRELVTEINYPGIRASEESVAEAMAQVDRLADEGVRWFVLAGSLPRGVSPDIYRHLIEALKAKDCKVVLDTSGVPFDRALPAVPTVIKPNIAELHEIVGTPLDSHAEIVSAARGLAGGGIELSVVSMREKGALFITQDRAVLAVPPKARIASTVGAGDAMVAGVSHGILSGMELPEIARLSTAFSLGALGQLGPNLPPSEDIDAFAELVEVTELSGV
ncbi:1-phosphofructokinase [Tropicimonas sp. IMCC6043]|uniref:1-phosphofructokinase n=1 Tax=Tropicimonas sp. IMCC6043 TaxID=2510645 RepID=UPI00101D073F|nr:1-phosphofructokinase [Tropicimonas sp. IMCC6043]RYH09645.1 1-phosphofructokinase [Tropicimonas sp. IMCC6043]